MYCLWVPEQLQQAAQGLGCAWPLISHHSMSCQWELAMVQEKSTSIQEDKWAVGILDASRSNTSFQSPGAPKPNNSGLYLGLLAAHLRNGSP